MTGWRDLPQLLTPRIQEAGKRRGAVLMRFDNGLYLRVEAITQPLQGVMLYLRFALLQSIDGRVTALPLEDAARHITGGRGYRFTEVVGQRVGNKGTTPGAIDGLEHVKSRLSAKSGMLFLAAAVRPERLELGAPAWNARAEFTIRGEFEGLLRPPDVSGIAQRILETLDEIKQFLVDCTAQSPAPSFQPR